MMPLDANEPIAPEIKLNGSVAGFGDLGNLVGFRIRLGLRLPGRAEMHIYDEGFKVAAGGSLAIGTAVSIAMGYGRPAVFTGEVTGVSMRMDHGDPLLTVTIDDAGYKLGLGTHKTTYTQMTYSDIVRKIAGECGLKAEVTATAEQFDYVLQADTHLGFLSELADRSGCDWWVEDSTLHFKPASDDAPSVGTFTLGENLIGFEVRASALHPSEAQITGWDHATKAALSADGKTTAVPHLPTASLVTPFVQASRLSAQAKTSIAVDNPVSAQEAQALATRAVAHWLTGAVTARGTLFGNDALKLRSSAQIAGTGPVAGTYVITEIEHSYTGGGGLQTRFTAGERRPRSLVDALGRTPSSSFRRDGLVVGVVTKVGNSSGSPGDVQVKYPGVDEQLSSNWCRIATLGGGKSRGITFMPEVNDEVIVGFEGGDPRRPVILGGLFNGKDSQPAFKNANNQIGTRQLTSRLGHTVEFGDGTEPADQYIGLALAGGHHVVKLGKDKLNAEVPAGTPITVKSGRASIEIDDSGQITITGQKITLKSTTDLELSGVNVTAKANVKASLGGATVELKGQAMVDISASGPAKVAGNPVMVN